MTRVVIIVAGGEHIFAYFGTRERAKAYIAGWVAWVRANEGQHSTELLLDDAGECVSIARAVLAMYIPEDRPTATERVANALEKQVNTGEEWR